jgi:predicted DNA repair protein MutK
MPVFLKVLGAVGTAAMLWVGGSIRIHTLAQIGLEAPEHLIHSVAVNVAHSFGIVPGLVEWLVTSGIQAVVALIVGGLLIVIMGKVVGPAISLFGR